ncbi:MAG TPA: protein kinase, partial [Acidimicrobiia bacterium]|nr:protein kinase [Acidimicrobiia bacterium]
LHRKVALKVLRPELAAALGPERFLREIEIAANLTHPHILPLHDSGEADGFLYYVMPYVEGQSLRDKLAKEGELPIGEAVRILRDVVDALTAAHAHGVVHRDIKPENVLLSGRHALVTDFGVAKAVSEATGRQQLTTAGVALGTPAYMAPEQAAADPHLDHRVDIYAVGAMAYELLTGRPVFMGTTAQQVLSAHVTEAPQPVTKHRDTVPPALEAVVMRCLEKKPADRFRTAEELLPQLEALATPSGGITPTQTRPVAALGGGRRWLVPMVVGSVAALLALAVAGTRVLKHRPITVTVSNIHPLTSSPEREWRSAVSPDGSQVAFVAEREGVDALVIKSARGGADGGEVTVTLGGGDPRLRWLNRPTWSPDGERIRVNACASRWVDCTWLETGALGGAIRAVDLPVTAEWAAWSPDGSRIALVTAGDTHGLFVYEGAGDATAPPAVASSTSWYYWPVWSPDGRWIAFLEGIWYNGPYPTATSIWIVDADGGDPVRITSDPSAFSPAWLDADHLLFLSDRDGPRELYVVEVGAGGPRGAPQKVAGVADALSLSYASAGRTLTFIKATTRQNIWSFPLGHGTVSIADGRPVTRENAVVHAHDVSPDGSRLAFSSDRGRVGDVDIYVHPLEGGSATPVAAGPLLQSDPRWSPDGTEIAYYEEGTPHRLMVVSADGRTRVEVDSARLAFRPSWSPTGLDLAYSAARTEQFYLDTWVVSRASLRGPWGEPKALTDVGCWSMDWAPDGSGVLCGLQSGDGTLGDLVLVSPDADELWRYDPATDGLRLVYSYSVFSEDGSTIYTRAEREDGTGAGVWAIPVRGGAPRLVVAYDDPGVVPMLWLAVRSDVLYLTVGELESDVWVADVEVER